MKTSESTAATSQSPTTKPVKKFDARLARPDIAAAMDAAIVAISD